MKKRLLIVFVLISSITNSQNRKLIKDIFYDQTVSKIETIALNSGFKGSDIVSLKVTFKSDIDGVISNVNVDNQSFNKGIIEIVQKISKLNPKEYSSKGNEAKFELEFRFKLPSDSKRKRRIKRGRTENIKFLNFYVKEYYPVKWIEVDNDKTIPFSIIERKPITKNCKDVAEIEIKKCVSKEISMHVARKFNVDLAQEIGLHGRQKIVVKFIISSLGEIVNIEAEGEHKLLSEEGVRVINLLPKFYKPGIINEKPVNVRYIIPIWFNVQE